MQHIQNNTFYSFCKMWRRCRLRWRWRWIGVWRNRRQRKYKMWRIYKTHSLSEIWKMYIEGVVVRWWRRLWRFLWRNSLWYKRYIYIIKPKIIFSTWFIGIQPTNCTEDQFECANGLCVPKTWLCDNDNDCKDFSDELNCTKTG